LFSFASQLAHQYTNTSKVATAKDPSYRADNLRIWKRGTPKYYEIKKSPEDSNNG